MPINKSIKEFSIKLLFILPIKLMILEPLRSQAYNFNETRSSFTPPTNASNSTHYYANHRMDTDNVVAGNLTVRLMDRQAMGSILRPQVAVQIYANPTISQQESAKTNNRSTGVSGSSNDDLRQQQRVHITDNPRQASDKQASKLNHWHYETDQQGAHNQHMGSGPSGNDVDNSVAESFNLGSGPLINAIITVPNPSEHHHHHHHSQPQINYPPLNSNQDDSRELHTLPSGVDPTLVRLMDNQSANNNIEFSMNLNGDDIIINPSTNKGMIASPSSSSSSDLYMDSRREEEVVPRHYVSKAREIHLDRAMLHKSMKKQNDNTVMEGGSQQSASEINLIDGPSDDNDSDIEMEPQSSKVKEDAVLKQRAREIDDEAVADDDKRTSASRNYWNENSSLRSSDSSSSDDYADEKTTDESSHDGTRVATNLPRASASRFDPDDNRVSKQTPKRQYTRNGRKVSDTKRKASYKSSDDGDTVSFDDQISTKRELRDDQDKVSSVTIKGEDVRRFEKLLENLRALSMKNLELSKARRSAKTSPAVTARQIEQIDDDGFERNEDLPATSQEGSNKGWSGSDSRPSAHHQERRVSAKVSAQSYTDNNVDCGRRRQQQLQRAASNEEPSESAYEPDSSSKNSDQDSSSAADNSDDSNDDNSQTQSNEQDEPNTSNNSKVNPASSDFADDTDSSSQKIEVAKDEKERPKSVSVVRKTILQNFYDDTINSNPKVSKNDDDLKLAHMTQHETQHEKATGVQPLKQQQQIPASQRSRANNKVRSLSSSGSTTPVSYIDYNQLDDREVYRGSESKKVKTVVAPRRQTLQNMLERTTSRSLSKY